MTQRIMPGGMTEQIRYDLAGRTQRSWLENNGQKTREQSIQYYTGNSPYVGLTKTLIDRSRSLRTDYTAFDAFNRTLSVTHSGNAAIQGYTTTTTYDIRGIRTSLDRDYTDPAYEDTSVAWLTDGNGQHYQETLSISGGTHSSYQQKWNAAGRRTELLTGEAGNAVQRYVFDHDPDGFVASNTVHTSGGSQTFAFICGTSGLLVETSNSWATMVHAYSDAFDAGRLTGISTALPNGGATPDTFAASQAWREDNLRAGTGYIGSGLSAQGDQVDEETASRSYVYNARGQLTSETLESYVDFSFNEFENRIDLSHKFDQQNLGVRVGRTHTGWFAINDNTPNSYSGERWSIPAAKLDDFARMRSEVFRIANFAPASDTASGVSSGAGEIRLTLKDLATGAIAPVEGVEFNPDSTDGAWSVPLDLAPGQYELSAIPVDPSGSVLGAPDVSRFERDATGIEGWIDTDYDEQGYTFRRQDQDGTIQTFVWDAAGRLLKLISLDSSGDGFQFIAVYDPLGRRLRVENKTIAGGTLASSGDVILGTYDPQVRYQEVSVSFNGVRTWKIYGADLNGSYGGLHGIGGWLAAYVESSATYYPLILDTLGNVIAHVESDTDDRIIYAPNNASAYGVAPEETPKAWGETDSGSTTTKLWMASAWRGYRYDPTGFIHMGARCYDPVSGRFLSPDPLGHAESMDLYSFANGDPINFVDPTGRNAFFSMGGFFDSITVMTDPTLPGLQKFTDAAIVEPATDIKEFIADDSPGELRVQAGLFLAVDAQFTRDQTGAIRFMGGGGLGLGFATSHNPAPLLNSSSPEFGFDLSASGSLFSNLSGSAMYDQRFQFEDGVIPTSGTIDGTFRATPSFGGASLGDLYLQGGLLLAKDGSIEPDFDGGFNYQPGYSSGLGAFVTIRVGGNDANLPLGGEHINTDSNGTQDPIGKFPAKK